MDGYMQDVQKWAQAIEDVDKQRVLSQLSARICTVDD